MKLPSWVNCPDDWEYVGLVLVPNPHYMGHESDVYALHTDKATRTARALTNVTAPLKAEIRAYEAAACPIDELAERVSTEKV